MRKMTDEFNAGGTWQNQMLTSWLRVLVIYLSRLYNEQYGESKITQNLLPAKKFSGTDRAEPHPIA
jgi:AraC family transcriptional activator of pobA